MLQFATKHDDPDRKLGWVYRIGFGMASFGRGMMTAVLGSFRTDEKVRQEFLSLIK